MIPVSRAGASSWLWLLVAAQVAIPASYYFRDDRDDERFAWRMFSAVRIKRCQVAAFETRGGEARRLELEVELHSAWVHALERGRMRVMERFLESRCSQGGVTNVELLRGCSDAARRDLGLERIEMDCAARTLRVGSGGT